MRPLITERVSLPESVIAILLGGWSACPTISDDADSDAAFDLFIGKDVACAQLWRCHESVLRAEAQRRGVAPSIELEDGRRLFFGEFCCLPSAVQTAHWHWRGRLAAAEITPPC